MVQSDKTKRTENVLAATLAVLLGAVLLTSHAVSGVMARYTAAGTSNDEARVALFGHSETVTFDNWSNTLRPGSSGSVTLNVSNTKNGKTSEVAQSYSIQIETAGNLPLTFTLTDSDGNEVGTFSESSSAVSDTFTADDMKFAPGEPFSHAYTLEYSWPKDQKSKDLANIPDFLQVNINVKQID